MGEIAELTDAVQEFNNCIDLLSLHELIDALSAHSEALDRHASILEKMHEAAQKDRALTGRD
jgi:hypothetical protein